MIKLRYIFLILLILCTYSISSKNLTDNSNNQKEIIIEIDSQTDFDNLNIILNKSLKKLQKENSGVCKILFNTGLYKFNDNNQIHLLSINLPNIELIFAPKHEASTTIIADGSMYSLSDAERQTDTHYICKLKSNYKKGDVFIDENFNLVHIGNTGHLSSDKINRSKSNVSIYDGEKKIARLELPLELEALKNKESDYFKNSILYYKSWYSFKYGDITYTDDKFIYFYYDTTSNLDGDYKYAKEYPLFSITNINEAIEKDKVSIIDDNIYIPKTAKKIYSCKYNKLLYCNNTNFKRITITGLTFAGSSLFDKPHKGDQADLIDFTNSSNIEIRKNIFKNIGNELIFRFISKNTGYPKSEVSTSSNITIADNEVYNCYGGMFLSTAWNTTATGNITSNTNIFHKYRGVMSLTSKNFHIAKNEITDYGSYYAVTSGGSRNATNEKSGIIEYNKIYFSDKYKEDYLLHTVMDGGAIYIFTHQDKTVCQYNIIYNIKGRKGYRGIFCDDGAYNFRIIGNLIYNIDGFTIDSRYVPWKANVNTVGYPTNVNNIIENNILLGTYNFQGNPKYPTLSVKGINYIKTNIDTQRNTTIENVKSTGKDLTGKISLIKLKKDFKLPDFIVSYLEENNILNN